MRRNMMIVLLCGVQKYSAVYFMPNKCYQACELVIDMLCSVGMTTVALLKRVRNC
jgi:hypothetical protein